MEELIIKGIIQSGPTVAVLLWVIWRNNERETRASNSFEALVTRLISLVEASTNATATAAAAIHEQSAVMRELKTSIDRCRMPEER